MTYAESNDGLHRTKPYLRQESCPGCWSLSPFLSPAKDYTLTLTPTRVLSKWMYWTSTGG